MTDDTLPSTWRQSFYSLFPVEKHAIDERNTQAIGSIIARAAANGLALSGATISQIATELADSIPERVSVSIRIVQKITSAYEKSTLDEHRAEVTTLLQKLVVDQQAQLKAKALGTAPLRAAPQTARDAALRYIDLKANFEINRIRGEIDLMAAKKPTRPPLDQTAYTILTILKEEFVSVGRDAASLKQGYVGPSLPRICEAILTEGVSQVDFDLSLSALEKTGMVQTGPREPYTNPPGPGPAIFAIISKREYLCLTENGYRAANKTEARKPSPARGPSVSISDSNFYNSPVGAGTTVTQTVNFDVTNENETVNYLYELLSRNGGNVDASARREIKQMVDAANAGDMKAAKPIFQKLFGAAGSTVKELATGVLTAIVNKQLGLEN